MTILLSWSGARSRAVATLLRQYLSMGTPRPSVWMSETDIEVGTQWAHSLSRTLESVDVGILCLTVENVRSPWVLFEAGALSKAVDRARVLPYLIGIHPGSLDGPLAQFQCLKANHQGTLRLFREIGRHLEVGEDVAAEAAAACWPSLANALYWFEQDVLGKKIHRLTMRLPGGPNLPPEYPGWLLLLKAGTYQLDFEFRDAVWESQIVVFTTPLEQWVGPAGHLRIWTRMCGCRTHSDSRSLRLELTAEAPVFVTGSYKPGPPNPYLAWECSDPREARVVAGTAQISFEDGSGAESTLRIRALSSESLADCLGDRSLL